MRPAKVMRRLPDHTVGRPNAESRHPFQAEKFIGRQSSRFLWCAAAMWLKMTENNTLKKP
jgi:hypothetical protein